MAEKGRRGFASMDRERQRAIASKGGRAAHEKGTAHEFTPEEAREAGRKGGHAAHERGTAHQFASEEAREAGRKGGQRVRRELLPPPPPPHALPFTEEQSYLAESPDQQSELEFAGQGSA